MLSATLLRDSALFILFLQTSALECAIGPDVPQSAGTALLQHVGPILDYRPASHTAVSSELWASGDDKLLGDARVSASFIVLGALVILSLLILACGCYCYSDSPERQFREEEKKGSKYSSFCKMIAHFVVCHCHAIIMFYAGLRSYLATLAFWEATHIMIKTADELARRELSKKGGASGAQPFGEFLDCVKKDAHVMISSFAPDLKCLPPPSVSNKWGLPVPVNIILASFNYFGLLLVVITISVLLGLLLCKHRASGLGQGRYITFTYMVQGTIGYKVMAIVIVIFSVLLFLEEVRFLVQLYMTGDVANVLSFASDCLVSLLLIVYSSITLWQAAGTKLPFFDCTTEKFKVLEFNRGWKDVMTHNTAYTEALGMALLKAKDGFDDDLKAMCVSPLDQVYQSVVVHE